MRIVWMSLLASAGLLAACEPLPESAMGTLKRERSLAQADSIPRQYGTLVNVTPAADQPNQLLWFVQPDGTIVAVKVNPTLGSFGSVLTIPRR